MNWYQNLYLGKNAEKRKVSLIQKLEQKENPFQVYLITLPVSEANQLEILTAANYRIQSKHMAEPLIIGIALGMEEARMVVGQIAADVYTQTRTGSIRAYFTDVTS